jgi:GNAT superfamily N-acetyltransferase
VTTLRIRDAVPADMGALREGRTRTAVAGDQIVGFATWLRTGDGIELEDLFVDPARMGRGAGRALMVMP